CCQRPVESHRPFPPCRVAADAARSWPPGRETNRQTFPSMYAEGQARSVATAKQLCDGRGRSPRKRSQPRSRIPAIMARSITWPPRREETVRELAELAERFWAWRARQQPRTRDDIPRLERPAGWLPEVDPALAASLRDELGAFQAELARIRPDQVPDRVDH